MGNEFCYPIVHNFKDRIIYVFFTKCMESLCTPHKEAWYMFFQSIKRILIKNRPQKVREGGGRKAARKKLWKNKFLLEKYVVEDIITYMF